MPRSVSDKVRKPPIESQFALADRVLRGLNKSIDAQMERARDLEVEHARALYKSGKATIRDGRVVIEEARRRVG